MSVIVNISFFDSAATVIPTFLIAVVFTGKLMDNWKLEFDEKAIRAERKGRIAEYLHALGQSFLLKP